MSRTNKFILIDHSICGYGGHYFEYAIHVLRAAKQQGFQPILVVNRQFQPCGNEDFEIIPVFEYDFWGNVPQLLVDKNSLKSTKSGSDKSSLQKIKIAFFIKGQISPHLFSLLLGNRVGSLLFNIAARPVHTFKWIAKKFKEIIAQSNGDDWSSQVSKHFSESMARTFAEIDVRDGDEIFIPTISEKDLTGLGYFFNRVEQMVPPCRWHLLFRRDLYTDRIPSSAVVNNKTLAVSKCLVDFRRFTKSQKVFFYTDTDELTQQYQLLQVFDFKTLAIPVNPLYEKCQLPRGGEKCTVTYLGDARVEKGFQYLPRVIMDLWSNYVLSGRLSFRLQANFNSSCQDPSVIMAKSQLFELPRDKVELIDRALSSEEYADVVISSDIVLILYDSDSYSARSSGIFVEAMMAGKPVVVPAGSWMSKQLTASITEYHKTLLGDSASKLGNNLLSVETPSFLFSGEPTVFTEKLAFFDGRALLLLFMEVLDSVDGLFVKVIVDTYDENENHINQFSEISNPVAVSGDLSFMVPIDPNAKYFVVSFRNAYDEFVIKACNARYRLFCSDKLPARSAVGGIYSESNQISDTLCELVDNLEHYRTTAAIFSSAWRTRQGVDRLIEGLLCE